MSKEKPGFFVELPPINGFVKKADSSELGNDTQFEQSFSNLAHAYLKDKAPGLLDYEVGFELMERNEDNTKAVGIFGFKVGAQWLYAPVFFINGDLKGHELLYLKDQDQFVPLKENWLNYILRRKPASLGKKTDQNMARLGFLSPDLQAFSRPPAKFASANEDIKEMKEGLKNLAKFACTNPESDPKFKNPLTLKSFLKKEASRSKEAYKQLLTTLLGTCQQFPKMAEAIEKMYGKNFFKESVDAYKAIKEPSILDSTEVSVPVQQKQALTIVVRSFSASSDGVVDSSDSDKKKLVTDGVIFNDARSADELAIPYRVQSPTSIENPPTTGIYDLLVSPFAMIKTVIFLMPHGPTGRQDFATVVSYEGDKSWINSHPGNLFTRPPRDKGQDAPESKTSGKSYSKFFEGLSDIKSMTKGNVYMAVSESGDASVPFEVIKSDGNADGTDNYRVKYLDWASQSKPNYLPHVIRRKSYGDFDMNNLGIIGGGNRLHVTDKPGIRIKAIKGELYIPGNFKVIKLKGNSCCGDGSITPGSLTDLQHAVYQKTASLKVTHTGSEVSVNGRTLSPENALIHLVRDVSMSEKHARCILEEAKENKVVSYRLYKPENAGDLIKSAAPGDNIDPSMIGATASPAFPVEPTGMEQTLLGSVKSTYPLQQALPAMSSQSLQANSAIYDPKIPDPKTMAIGYNAASTGQKEVFDTSMIGSLVKTVRDDSMVDAHLGDLMKGLDKIGRILFSFYWHKDKFEDRYGKKDLPELEDGLKNAFEQLGDLMLFLKQKTIDAYPDEGISLEGDA